jgi:Zn finger protein HypA/HybF involved in hydrogenase expression
MAGLNYSTTQIEEAVKASKSLAGVLRALGLLPVGGNYRTIKKRIKELNLDTSHFTGKAWIPKGAELKKFDDLTTAQAIKKRLINERGHRCECCRKEMWLGGEIVLELDHVNGDRDNNSRENLQLLCPNCHALTPTYRGKNIGEHAKNHRAACYQRHRELKLASGQYAYKEQAKPSKKKQEKKKRLAKVASCIKCNAQIGGNTKTQMCANCYHESTRKVERPAVDMLIQEIQNSSFLSVGKKYGVSDNAIRKWLRMAGIDPRGIMLS